MMASAIIDWNNWKQIFSQIKFSQVNFKKNSEILDQFNNSMKSYIEMFAGLQPPPPPPPLAQVGL